MRESVFTGAGGFGRSADAPSRPNRPKLGDRSALLLSAAVTTLGVMLWFFYLYTPTTQRITDLEMSAQRLEAQVTLARAARANLPELRAEVAHLGREREGFLAQLPEQNDVAGLLDQLREAAADAGVVLSALQNTGPVAEAVAGVRLLGFSLATEGTYRQTITFLRALETLPRFTNVRRVGLVAGEANSDPLLSASYDFSVYVFTGPEAAEGDTAPDLEVIDEGDAR